MKYKCIVKWKLVVKQWVQLSVKDFVPGYPSKKNPVISEAFLVSDIADFPHFPYLFCMGVWGHVRYYEGRKWTSDAKMSHVYYPLSYKCCTCPRGISCSETDIRCPKPKIFLSQTFNNVFATMTVHFLARTFFCVGYFFLIYEMKWKWPRF